MTTKAADAQNTEALSVLREAAFVFMTEVKPEATAAFTKA